MVASDDHRLPGGLDGEELACQARDVGLIPGSGRPPGGGNGNPLQCSRLGSPVDRGAWGLIQSVGSQKSRTKQSS